MLRNLLTVAAAVALTASLAAQSQSSAQGQLPVYKAVAPQFAGVYDMASGQFKQGTTFGPVSTYNNNTLTNYYSVPGQDQEWIDEGAFCDRKGPGAEEQINGFNFTYCSTEADPTQNSGTITFTFYDEFVICTGPSNGGNFANGGFVCAYDVVGLPLGDPNGVIQCWIVTVDLMKGFECNSAKGGDRLTTDEANGKLFGWGIIPRNNNTGPWLSTGGKGADNAFVWFDQFGIFQGCFWFGGTPFASFALQTFGYDDGVTVLYGDNPCDNVDLMASYNANGDLCIEICNPTAGEQYTLVASSSLLANPTKVPCDPSVGGPGTLCLTQPFLPPTPIPFPASNKITYSGALPPIVYLQAVCGPPQPNAIRGFSNVVSLCN